MVTPVRGYEFGVPDEAVGVTTNSEVKIFDEDEVDDHLGSGVDLSGLHDGDSDVVGAQSQTKYGKIERDEEIDYLNDYVAEPADIPASHDLVRQLLQSLADNGTGGAYPMGTVYGPYGPLGFLANYSTFITSLNPLLLPDPADRARAAAANGVAYQAWIKLYQSIEAYKDIIGYFSKDYDGVILNRETWKFHEDLSELDEKPDNDDNPAPFFADPRDWNDVAEHLQAYRYYIGSSIDGIQDYWGDNGAAGTGAGAGWYVTLALACMTAGGADPSNPVNWDFDAYEAINDTIYAQINKISLSHTTEYEGATIPLRYFLLGTGTPSDPPATLISPLLAGINNYTEDYVQGIWGACDSILETVYAQFSASIPDKAGFFLGQLTAGQPAMTPSDDFLKKVIKTYNLDEDGETLYGMYGYEYGKDLNGDGEISAVPVGAKSRFTHLDLGGETFYPYAYMTFEWDSTTSAVIVEIEWPDNYIDPRDLSVFGGDNEDDLSDFEIAFPYGDTGGQGTVSYMDGDDIFWQMGGVESIPGFEITILLGASAIAILGLIYVVMKKRKR